MPWNDPDRDKNKDRERDPWGSSGDGPPTLDDLFARFKRKRGGGGNSGGGGGGGDGISVVIGLAVVLLVLWLIYNSFSVIEEGEVGVLLRFGEFETVLEPGLSLHYPWPIDKVFEVDVAKIRSMTSAHDMLTQDENILMIKMGVQYQVDNARAFLFNVKHPEQTLASAAESALRRVVGNRQMDFVLSEGRTEIAHATRKLLERILESYGVGLEVMTVNLMSVRPPDEVADAFNDVTKAREDRQRYINQAQAFANRIIPRARGQAASVVQSAKAYRASEIARAKGDAARFEMLLKEYRQAPKVTRERLYLETMEEVMSDVSTVVMDVEGGNPFFYLPLQKMISGKTNGNGSDSVDLGVMNVTPAGNRNRRQSGGNSNGGRR